MIQKSKSVAGIISKNNVKDIEALSIEVRTLFGFLCLLTDIKYRLKYGKEFEDQKARGYSKGVQFNKVVADQKPPVDDGLLRH